MLHLKKNIQAASKVSALLWVQGLKRVVKWWDKKQEAQYHLNFLNVFFFSVWDKPFFSTLQKVKMVPPERLMHPHPLSTGGKSGSWLSKARVTHLQMGLQSLEAEKGPQIAHRPVIWALSYRLNQRTLQNVTEPRMLPHHLASLSDNCLSFTK